jgi:hypothetical protein
VRSAPQSAPGIHRLLTQARPGFGPADGHDDRRALRQLPGTTPVEVWAISHALPTGLQIYQHIAPDILTPAVFERACELPAGLYPED